MRILVRIDKSCWLLALIVLRGAMPWLQARLHASIPVALALVWIMHDYHRPIRLPFCVVNRMKSVLLMILVVMALYLFSPYLYELIGFGGGNVKGVYPIFATYLIQFCIMYPLYRLFAQKKIVELKFLMIIFGIGLIFTGMKSFFVGDEIIKIGSARALMGAQHIQANVDTVDMALASITSGLGTYGYSYMAAFISGPLLLLLVRGKDVFWKCLSFSCLLSCYFVIRSSGLGTPMFVLVVSLILAIMSFAVRFTKPIVSMGVMLGVFLVVFAYNPRVFSFLEPPFRGLAESFKGVPQLSYRLTSIADAFSGGQQAYAFNRYQLQKDSFETFLRPENIVFGGGEYYFEQAFKHNLYIGDHSMICDRLAREGLFGFIPFVLFFSLYVKYFRLNPWLAKSLSSQSVIAVFTGSYFFAAVSNPIDFLYPILHFALPVISLLIADGNQREVYLIGR